MATIADIQNREYATNAFIYEAKRRHWKPEAIIGVLAYMYAEGLGTMGTLTYESYWLVGPNGPYDTTLDNQYWVKYMQGQCRYDMRRTTYQGRGDIYSAFGLGLLADTDVYNNDGTVTIKNATNLLNYCTAHGRYWQDPEAQMNYFFTHSFTYETVFDTPGCDPTNDDRSAEEWCRRIVAGYGMPGWTWNSGNPIIEAHVVQVPNARTAYAAYPSNFQYIDYLEKPMAPRLDLTNMKNLIYWKAPYNPYCPTFGLPNCTCYAWGRFWEIGDWAKNGEHRPSLPTSNADMWYSLAESRGYTVSRKPKLGAVACFAGQHVSIVEKIYDNGDILTSNSAWGGQYFFTMILSASNYYFDPTGGQNCQGFILNPFASQAGLAAFEGCLQITCQDGFVINAETVSTSDHSVNPPDNGGYIAPMEQPPCRYSELMKIKYYEWIPFVNQDGKTEIYTWTWENYNQSSDFNQEIALKFNPDNVLVDEDKFLVLGCNNPKYHGLVFKTPFGGNLPPIWGKVYCDNTNQYNHKNLQIEYTDFKIFTKQW